MTVGTNVSEISFVPLGSMHRRVPVLLTSTDQHLSANVTTRPFGSTALVALIITSTLPFRAAPKDARPTITVPVGRLGWLKKQNDSRVALTSVRFPL